MSVVAAAAVLAVIRPPFVQNTLDAVRGRFAGDQASGVASPSLRWETLDQPLRPQALYSTVVGDSTLVEPVETTPTPRPREIVPPEPGTLFVNAAPWGTVFVDGRSIGNTPKANIEITPGLHVIRVERDGYEAYEEEVRIEAGATIRLLDIVLKPRQQ